MKASNKITLAACSTIHGLQDGLTASIYVLLPVLAQSFGLGYAQIGAIRAVHSGSMWLLEIPAGILSERLGQQRLLVLGLAGAGIGFLTLSLASGYHGVLLALLIAGCGAAFQHSLCSSLISNAFEGSARRVALGTYNASGDSGKLAFTGIASLLFGFGVAWHGLAAGYGLLALFAAGLLWLVIPAIKSTAASTRATRKSSNVAGWGIQDRFGFSVLAAVVFLDIVVQDGFLVFVAFLMIDKGVAPGVAAFAVVATLLGGVCGKLACGHLAARIGVIRSMVIVESLTAVGIVAVFVAPAAVAFVLLPLLGMVLQGSSSITYGSVSSFVHEARRSRGFALIYTMSSGASVAGPLAFGLVGDVFNLGAAVWLMVLVTLTVLPLCVLLHSALQRLPDANDTDAEHRSSI
jgi:MFS family permease